MSAHAAAWLQPKGSGLLILNALHYRSDTYVDEGGNEQPQPTFSKTELNPYAEYGLTDTLTVGANGFLQYFHQAPNALLAPDSLLAGGDAYGLEAELFARYRLWREGSWSVAVQPLIKLPSLYISGDGGRRDHSQTDLQLGVAAGYGRQILGCESFAELGAAYRHRFGAPSDQLRLDATAGVHLDERWTALLGASGILAVNEPDAPSFTGFGEDDHDLAKLSASLLYRITDNVSVGAGGFLDVRSRNTGDGGGVMLSLWRRF